MLQLESPQTIIGLSRGCFKYDTEVQNIKNARNPEQPLHIQ